MSKEQPTMFPKREERVIYTGKVSGNTQIQRQNETQKKSKTIEQTKYNERTEKQKNSIKRTKNQNPKRPRQQKRKLKKIKIPPKYILIASLVCVLCVTIFALVRKNGTEVFVGEQSMGILKDTKITAEQIITDLEAQIATEVGTNVKLKETITAEQLHISGERKKDVCTLEYMLPKLKSAVTYKVEAAVIFVDGSAVAPLATQQQAEEVLQKLKNTYYPPTETAQTTQNQTETQNTDDTQQTDSTENTATTDTQSQISFVEAVKIEKQFVDSSEMVSVEDAFSKLMSTTPVTATHTIVSGELLSTIAAEYDMTLEELLEQNEGLTLQTPIYVGQTLNVTIQKPMVSVQSVTTQTLTTVEKKSFETQYDDTKPASYQRVLQAGKDGQKVSTIQITRVNGFITEEKEISKEITVEPVTEIIVKGTL